MNEQLASRRELGWWTAIHTRPRCEKKVAEFAAGRGIINYLPLVKRRKRYQRRNVETFVPMFTGYVFARLAEDEREYLYQFQKVAYILPVRSAAEEEELVAQLCNVRTIELADLEKDVIVNPELVPGKQVVIAEGPLKGCRGVVERRGNRARVTVNLELLGSSVSTELNLEEINIEIDD